MTATLPRIADTRPPLPARSDKVPSLTIVTCVEAGPLEQGVVWMVESLRRFGGRFAQVPVIAVTPRLGPPLRRSTREAFDRLGVTYLRKTVKHPYRWYNFLNKPASLLAADTLVKNQHVAWLDADIFIAGQPDALELPADRDWAACHSDRNVGSTGPGDDYDPYWVKVCEAIGLDIEALPWVRTYREGMKVRFYFNGGVCVYRKESQYAQRYFETCCRALEARVSSRHAGLYFIEQCCFGLTTLRFNLRWHALPENCNYAIGSKVDPHDDASDDCGLGQAKVLHYHDSMWPGYFPTFLETCRKHHPELAVFAERVGPMSADGPIASRLMSKTLKVLRSRKADRFAAQCTGY
ncbi:MAG: hypothetical protein GC164_02210 [Phycisphaera sp.]|nr:hypothetical protein [Phycisphaera sp.]